MTSLIPISPFRPKLDVEQGSQSSSSNSPAQQYFEESDFYTGNNGSQSSLRNEAMSQGPIAPELLYSPANRLPAEVLIGIFSKLSHQQDLLNCMLVSKRWARNSVDQLWHRPACTTWAKHSSICRTLSLPNPYFVYRNFIKRLNLAGLAEGVNDGSVLPLAVCNRVERLTLTGCEGLSDNGLMSLLDGNQHLLALDISGDIQITERSMEVLAKNCPRLQGLNITGCIRISSTSMALVADRCRYIKRLKLNDCNQLDDTAIIEFAKKCPHILEIDLHQCKNIGNESITALLQNGRSLRELRLANCDLISDSALLSLPVDRKYENLRILDLTFCTRLTDRAVEKIIKVAPRLRNVVFAKCRLLTDVAIDAISSLGKNLHYLHLGHCVQITDKSIINLVASCNRIRIGLVKCNAITDASVIALARGSRFEPQHQSEASKQSGLGSQSWINPMNAFLEENPLSSSSLERSIIYLLNNCVKLTHLSLTGVQAFLRNDLEQFCREAPPEFTEHQRNVFCVFSGQGVVALRKYLNSLANTSVADIINVDEDENGSTMVENLPTHNRRSTNYAALAIPRVLIYDGERDHEHEESEVGIEDEKTIRKRGGVRNNKLISFVELVRGAFACLTPIRRASVGQTLCTIGRQNNCT
ncbi:ubiquitin ligase complex F-box protein GRR1 [Blumeria hordei DH14]|uniref:Ubiquitin ligase complex F-box protein GRR1 n=1 Tax=Blumeria graminis f. sp. hordei (strain DH14) TaxID=546991 RepID=N1JMN5_BLUG1|nr:ubiquitin ligase complex F-box protein GRR1 [Blumeria hordei DH14]